MILLLLVDLAALVFIGSLAISIVRWAKAVREVRDLEKLVDRVLDTAYQYNELDHPLSTVIRGMINKHRGSDNA